MGLKYSASHFYVADSGEAADPPHWLKQSQEKLTRLQQKLGRMRYGSRNYQETVRKLRLLHEHIANQRLDFIHKESRRIANAWDAVCVRDDDMNALNRVTKHGNVLESGFGAFRESLRYKLARQGKQLLVVDRNFPSTRTCFTCGHVMTGETPTRHFNWTCPNCGASLKWEFNAARNIKAQGFAQYFKYEGAARKRVAHYIALPQGSRKILGFCGKRRSKGAERGMPCGRSEGSGLCGDGRLGRR